MKRLIAALLSLLIAASLPLECLAVVENEANIKVIYFEDGSYMTEEIIEASTRASQTISGSKVRNYYGSDGSLEWKVALNGTFTYTGSSASCTRASCDVSISDSAWSSGGKSAYRTGNTANCSVTMTRKEAGVTQLTVPVSLTLKCDANGNLS